MKKYLVIVVSLGLFVNVAYAQKLKDTIPQVKTKLEQFSVRTGVVLIRGFQKIGTIQGLYNSSVNIESKEFTNVSSGTKQYGITIEAVIKDRYEKKHTSFIDYDEIDSLIKGIEYISKANSSVTKFENFQADYKTKGYFEVSTFSSSNGTIKVAVSSGNIGAVAAYFNIDDLAKIKDLLLKAKVKIDQIK